MLAQVNPKNQLFEIMSQFHKKGFCLCVLLSALALQAAPPPSRIVTVGGAATEIVFALGAGDRIVAVDLSSTYPDEVRDLPQVGYIRNISPEGILSMKPDLIVTTESLGPPGAKKMLKEMSLPIVWLPEPNSVEALESSLRAVGEKLGAADQAEAVITDVKAKLAESKDASASWSQRPSAIFFLSPPGAGGGGRAAGTDTRADALIAMAGGTNAAAGFQNFQPMSLETLMLADPDVIFVGISPGHGASPESVEAMKKLPGLSNLKAVKNNAVFSVPMDDLNFGPRLGEAVARWHGHLANAK